MGVDGEEFAFMKAKLEEISTTLCDLKPLTAQITNLVITVGHMVEQVKGHSITLYGERTESGLVGRVERVEAKVNQLMGIVGVIGTSTLLWILAQLFGLIKP